MRIFVHSRREMDEHLTRRKHSQGLEAESAAYGFNIAEERGLQVSYSRDKPHSKLSEKLFWKFDLDFFHALDNLPRMRRADAIWTVLEWEWLAISALQKLGVAARNSERLDARYKACFDAY